MPRLKFLAAACLLGLGVGFTHGLLQPASAAVLYDDGPINGTINAWRISFGGAVSDSFTLLQDSTVTGVSFGVWTQHNIVNSVAWAIATTPGTFPIDGTAAVTGSPTTVSPFHWDLTTYSFSTGNVALAAGTYYLVLQNASGTNNDPEQRQIYWDETNGPSTASANNGQTFGSESFQITGFVATTPLPSTWVMLLSGFVGLGFFAYRGSKKRTAALATAQ